MRRRHHHLGISAEQFRGGQESSPVVDSIISPRADRLEPPPQDAADAQREKGELDRQLFEAAQIQRRLSGPRVLRRGNLDCAREVFAAGYLSGDFTLFWAHGAKILAVIGDIAGKGLPAGMWFTHLVGLLQHYAVLGAEPSSVATEVNRHLCSLRPLAPFVTMFLAEIDSASGEFVYCTAGHFPPVLLRANDHVLSLETGGPLLGALAESAYEDGRQRLEPGDTILAYSDGVLECRNKHDEEFGLDRFISEARRSKRDSAQMAVLALLGAVQDFAAGSPLCDDTSLLVVRRSG
jgi:serine phosphatase RsbU (regulator of sigma subunit)